MSDAPTLFSGGSVRRDLFGGKGAVRVRTVGVGPGLPPPFTAALACELEAGGHVGSHRQEHDEEFVLVVEGTGQGEVSGQNVPLAPGVLLPLPLGAVLSLRADAVGPLRYLIVKAHLPK